MYACRAKTVGPKGFIFGMEEHLSMYSTYNLCQYTHPMGSGRPPWAAGEFEIPYE